MFSDDFIRYGTLGGKYAGKPNEIASLFEDGNLSQKIDEPLVLSYLNGRKEQWPKAIDYISHYIELFRQWAYRRTDGDKVLLQEIDNYIKDLYEWLKQGREKDQLDDIEKRRLIALKESLTDKLYEYVPERLTSGGQASIKQLLDDIENSEHITRYPPRPSGKWYNAEIERLCLLSEKIKLLMRLAEKIHPENANKYHYLYYLGKVTGDIAGYVGVLERSRDGLYESIVKDKIDIEEHLSKIDGRIDETCRDIKRHFSELHECLVASEPLEIREIVRAFRQYLKSKDISSLPPIRQLHNTLRKHKEPSPEDTSKLADFIIALSRAIRSEAGYHHWLLHKLLSGEVLREIENLDTSEHQRVYETSSDNGGKVGDESNTQKEDGQGENDNDREIDSETKEQTWRDETPEYIPNADAVRMADGKISPPGLSKLLRKPGNIIRWMRNKETRRSKVHTQDFKQYIKNLKSVSEFSEAVFKQRERQEEIDRQKRNTGK